MATFRVGQRVKNIADTDLPEGYGQTVDIPIGAEGTVVGPMEAYRGKGRFFLGIFPRPSRTYWVYPVLFDDYRRAGPVVCEPRELAPLVDPKALEFVERIKRIEREPIKAAPIRVQ